MTVEAGVYAVDAATGLPDTSTPFGGMAVGTKSAWDSNYFDITLGTDCTISDLSVPIAVVMRISDYTSGWLRFETPPLYHSGMFPYTVTHTGAWQKLSEGLCICIKYSDGSVGYIPGTFFGTQATQSGLAAGAWEGLKITMPFACRVIGCVTRMHPTSNQRNHQAQLRNAAGTVIGTAYRYNQMYRATSGGFCTYQSFFKEGGITLAKDDVVRLVIYNADSSAIDMYNWSVYAGMGGFLEQAMGAQAASILQATASGTGDRNLIPAAGGISTRPLQSLIIDQIDIPGGGVAMPGVGGLIR